MDHIRSFVLRSGRMSDAQQRAYERDSPFRIPYRSAALDITHLTKSRPVIVEIGFGMGDTLACIAAQNPDTCYIGIEVHKAGIGKLLMEIEAQGLSNIRIIEHDAVEVLETMLPEASLDGVHLFFPDPWPKKRHHKRRLISPPFTRLLASRLKPGGFFYMVTDWADYAHAALGILSAEPLLYNAYPGFAPPQASRPTTKFERKGINKQHEIFELYFCRRRESRELTAENAEFYAEFR
ncbi:tRNA (guanosine(46)-N7)-methyltransferase TrmB [Breznakiellaceae bacterium SP9]